MTSVHKSFSVQTHVFEAQHIRHYPDATRNGDSDELYLEAKEYIPLSNPNPQEGDVTIIALHATAFPKELYEPVWEDLLTHSERAGFRIRAIWIADASNQGASGVLNEKVQGDDPSWMDHARDMLHMTNVFRKDMIQPIVGIGHSIGGSTLVHLSLMHPRLFAGLVFVDPILSDGNTELGPMLFFMASHRADLFSSREVAEKIFKKQYKRWDQRTFNCWMRYGLRETPTALYPEPGKLTLKTTKANESWSVGRSQFEELAADGKLSKVGFRKYPDAIPEFHPFYQGAIPYVEETLPKLQPDVLYMMPEMTIVSKGTQENTFATIGTARGGSGGAREGRAVKAIVKGGTHLCMFEKPDVCARHIADWLGKDLKEWEARNEYRAQSRDDKSSQDRLALSKEWISRAKKLHDDWTKAGTWTKAKI